MHPRHRPACDDGGARTSSPHGAGAARPSGGGSGEQGPDPASLGDSAAAAASPGEAAAAGGAMLTRRGGRGLCRRRDEVATLDGLGGLFFFLKKKFRPFTEAGTETASVNVVINHDDGSEVVKTVSVNAFCPPR